MAGFGKRKPERLAREKRRAARSNAHAPAYIQTTASQLPVTIVNISATGARLTALDCPPSRQDVILIVNGLSLFGKIVWRRDKAFAVKFEEGFHDYTAAEICEAVEKVNTQSGEFNRELALVELINREPRGGDRPTDAVTKS